MRQRASFDGDIGILGQLAALMVPLDPRSEVLPGTAGRDEFAPAKGSLEAILGTIACE